MRVLMVHNEYSRPSGEENAVRTIARLLEDNAHQVRWFLKSSVTISDRPCGKVRAFFSGIYSPTARAEMDAILAAEAFDIVQVQNLYPLLSPSVLEPCRRRGIAVVMRCPNYRLFCPSGMHLSDGQICERCLHPGREWWCLLRNCEDNLLKSLGYATRNFVARRWGLILRNVTVFMVLSEFQKERFVAAGIPAERVEVISNIAEPREEPPQSDTGQWVSFIGRISREKGLDTFCDAARRLPEAPFAIAGDPAGFPALAAAAPPNVSIKGFLSGSAMEEFYRNTRLLVVPSVCYEGFPNVIIGAMVRGKPVICSRLGCLPEIVEDGATGLTFEPGSAADLAAKIRRLLDAPDLCRRMGQAGREKALRTYSGQVVYEKLMSIYRKAQALASAAAAGGPTC